MNFSFEGPCVVVQDETRSEPVIHLRRSPESDTIEVLTIQEAHALLAQHDMDFNTDHDYWFYPLADLLEGIR